MTVSACRLREQQVRDSSLSGVGNGLIVSRLSDIRWISGFSGSNACIALSPDQTHLFTDGRYAEQASQQCSHIGVTIVSGSAIQSAVEWLQARDVDNITIQAEHVTAAQLMKFKDEFNSLSFTSHDPFPFLRAVKDASELSNIRSALSITETVFEEVLSLIRPGISENELAAEIDFRQRLHGAQGSSFDTIVAFGTNSSLPHARPGIRVLENNQPVLLDFGCVIEGYASDMTRTVFLGTPSPEFKKAYSSVSDALEAVTSNARSGLTGQQLDAQARDSLASHDFDQHFLHSLGHGVGLDIHEWPTLSKRGVDILPDGCVVTFEPGVYLSNEFGIRIENMAILRPESAQILNSFTTDLIVL